MASSKYMSGRARSAPQTEPTGLEEGAAPSSPNDSGRTTPEHASTPKATIVDSQSSPGSSVSSSLSSPRKSSTSSDEIIVAQPRRQAHAANTSPTKPSPSPRSSISPARSQQKKRKFANIIEDSDSELSSLGSTPPPPSPTRRLIGHLDRQLECRCGGWCTCPKHRFYPHNPPIHLSEWALSQKTEAVVSAVRSTIYRPQVPPDFVYPSTEIASQYNAAAFILSRLDGAGGAAGVDRIRMDRALCLAQDIITCFPPSEDLPGSTTAIKRVLDALRMWQKDGSYKTLWTGFDEAVNGNPDLVLEFQAFLPRERGRVGVSELWRARVERLVWEREERGSRPLGWVGG